MKYARLFLSILFTLSFALTLRAQESRAIQVVPSSHRYALLIGVNEYPNAKAFLSTLPSAAKDMKDLATALEEYAGFPRENITLMTDDSPEDLLPTRANIRAQVTKLLPKLTQNDLLIVAFSGHGVTIDYQDDTAPRPYFCVRDTTLPDTKTLVRRDWLFDKIDECEADRKIFFCDACRTLYTTQKLTQLASRSGKKASIRSLQNPSETWGYNYILMSSCAEGQNSIDTGTNGLFTSYLLEGLRTSKAASVDGDLTAFSWFEYAAKKTETTSEKMIAENPALVIGSESQRRQTPRIECRGEMSRFVIAKLTPAGPEVVVSGNVEDVEVQEYKVGSLKIQVKPTEPPQPGETLHAGKIQLPPIPEKINELMGVLKGIDDALARMENGTHEALREAKQAKAAAQAQYEAIKLRRDEAWEKLTSELRSSLETRIRQSPDASPTSFSSLRPSDVSFSEFVKLVLWGQKTEQALLERERVEKLVGEETRKEIDRMKADREKTNTELKQETEKFRYIVVEFLLTKSPGWKKPGAKQDYLFLAETVPTLLKYPFGWDEESLFVLAEKIWANSEITLIGTIQPVSLRQAGDRIVLQVDGIEYAFRWCPPGEFIMGGTSPDEKPVHKVKLTRGFWMLETEVTQEMWENVMGTNPSNFKDAKNPVERVSWNDCQSFCQNLSQKLGQQVQLPTEAQWEYACRAGTTGEYVGTLDEMAWYRDNSGSTTHTVGQKKPNAWGLYDMRGNVWEWCSDYYGSDFYSMSPASDPENTTVSSEHVDRGGCWCNTSEFLRPANRDGYASGFRFHYLGLRVLLVLNQEIQQIELQHEQQQNLPAKTKKTKTQELLKPGNKAGDRITMTVDGIEYAFRWCPPGEFMMGSEPKYSTRQVKITRSWFGWAVGASDTKEERDITNPDEHLHNVKLTQGFWLLETEVTQEMWQSVMGESIGSKAKQGTYDQDLYGTGPNFPMYYVSWNDSQEFCKKLTQKLGQQVQLPTEAQWEYACRAGTTGAFAGTLDEMAWYVSNSGSTTHAVGQKKPNAWGLYDMHGNVYEWCSDYYDENYYSRSPTSAPENTTTSSGRVNRGGSWGSSAGSCRSAYRIRDELDDRHGILGLRISLVPGQD